MYRFLHVYFHLFASVWVLLIVSICNLGMIDNTNTLINTPIMLALRRFERSIVLIIMYLYHAGTFSDFKLLKNNVECDSGDKKLGDFDTLAECARACQQRFRFRLQAKQQPALIRAAISAKCSLLFGSIYSY